MLLFIDMVSRNKVNNALVNLRESIATPHPNRLVMNTVLLAQLFTHRLVRFLFWILVLIPILFFTLQTFAPRVLKPLVNNFYENKCKSIVYPSIVQKFFNTDDFIIENPKVYGAKTDDIVKYTPYYKCDTTPFVQ